MKSDTIFLQHILDEINFLLQALKGTEYSSFLNNDVLTRACARSLEIIGEAAKNLSPEFKNGINTSPGSSLPASETKSLICISA